MDLRLASESDATFPPVLYVHPGTAAQGAPFFERLDPEARTVADPEGTIARGFGLKRGGLRELFGPSVWACGLRATRKGHGIGRPTGDVRMMPGMFLVRDGRILWEHRARHAGDHPDLARLPAMLAAATAPAPPMPG